MMQRMKNGDSRPKACKADYVRALVAADDALNCEKFLASCSVFDESATCDLLGHLAGI